MKISKVINPNPNEEEYIYWCAGCKHSHAIWVREQHPCWTFDGNFERPTIKPSVKIEGVCHHIITDGMIAYQADCSHELDGQTIEMSEID